MSMSGKGKAFIHRSSSHNEYPTPYSMTQQLLDIEPFDKKGLVLEPCCGEGAITLVLERNGFEYIRDSDINQGLGADFLEFSSDSYCDYVITNPPYGKGIDLFVIKAKSLYRKKIAFLMRLNWLSGSKRFKMNVYSELKSIYIFTRMPDLRAPIREDGKYPTAGIVYAWFVWEKDYKDKPMVSWLDNKPFVLKKKES